LEKIGIVVVARKMEDIKLNLPNMIKVVGPMSLNEARNIGASQVNGELIAFIDDDNILAPDALDEMAEAFRRSENIGAVSPVIFDKEGRVWFAGVSWSTFGAARIRKDIPLDLRYTEGFHNVFVVKREAFEKVGGFDSKHFPFYLGEQDLAERMKKLGYRFVVASKAHVWHQRGKGKARGSHIRTEQRAYLVGRNRLLFLHLYYPRRFMLHLLILPALATFHILSMVADRKLGFIPSYLRGIKDGL
jgi:O-antigen biosynthesis protein